MDKKSKTEKVEKAGKLGGLFGFTTCAILRRLGKEGVSSGHAVAILAAKGIKVSKTTASIQCNAGLNKVAERGTPADLTAAQVKELVASAPDPKTEQEEKAKDSKKSDAK